MEPENILQGFQRIEDKIEAARLEHKEDLSQTRHDIRDELGGRIVLNALKVEKLERKIETIEDHISGNKGRDRVILWGGALSITGIFNWFLQKLGSF